MIGYGTLPSWSNICGTCCDKITIIFLVESKRAFQMKKYQNIYIKTVNIWLNRDIYKSLLSHISMSSYKPKS